MARNRNRQRVSAQGRRRGRGQNAGFVDSVGFGDWWIPSGHVDETGTFVSETAYGVKIDVGSGSNRGIHLCQIPTVDPQVVTAAVGELEISAVVGDINITLENLGTGNPCELCMGMYVSEQNSVSGKWSMLGPHIQRDCQREDWLFLKSYRIWAPSTNDALVMINIPIALPMRVRLGGGQTLAFIAGATSIASGTFSVFPYLRARVTRVL